MLDGESKAQRGQALGPTARSKAPACSYFLPLPVPPVNLIFLLMLEWATWDPASGPLHFLLFLPRMLCSQIFPRLAPSCQSSLSSSVPSEKPSLTSVTEVAHTPTPIICLGRLFFLVAVITVENYLIYLFTYLLAIIPIPVLFSAVPPTRRIVLDIQKVLSKYLIHSSVAELGLEFRSSASCHKTGKRCEMGEKQVSHGRGSSCLRSGDLGSKHSFATVTPGDLGQCLFFAFSHL